MPIRLKLTKHFQARQVERRIDLEHVRQAILHPDSQEPAFDGKVKVRKRVTEGKTIEVIYFNDGFRDAPNDRIIVTAYYI